MWQPGVLDYTRIADCFLDCPLKNRLVDMIPSFFTGHCVLPPVFLREDPLPAPFLRRIGIFAVERSGHLNAPPAFGQVFLMDRPAFLETLLKRRLERFRKHGDPVFRSLAVANEYLVPRKVNVLNPQAQAFHQT